MSRVIIPLKAAVSKTWPLAHFLLRFIFFAINLKTFNLISYMIKKNKKSQHFRSWNQIIFDIFVSK